MLDIAYFFVALIPCVLGSVAGVGGGIIIKPVLSIMGTLNVAAINFLCAFTIFSMACVTLFQKYRKHDLNVDLSIGLPLAFGAIVGGSFGKFIFRYIRLNFENPNILASIQSGLLVILTISVFIYSMRKAVWRTYHIQSRFVAFLASLFLGICSAFIGIGGGPFNVAVLYLLFSMDLKAAALNSVFIIFFSQLSNILFTVAKHAIPEFTATAFICMLLGGMSGGFFGDKLSRILSLGNINKIYNSVLLVVTMLAVYNLCHYLGNID